MDHIVRAQVDEEVSLGGRSPVLTRDFSASWVSAAMQQNDRDAPDAFLFERFLHEARWRRQVVSHACTDERSQLRSANPSIR